MYIHQSQTNQLFHILAIHITNSLSGGESVKPTSMGSIAAATHWHHRVPVTLSASAIKLYSLLISNAMHKLPGISFLNWPLNKDVLFGVIPIDKSITILDVQPFDSFQSVWLQTWGVGVSLLEPCLDFESEEIVALIIYGRWGYLQFDTGSR